MNISQPLFSSMHTHTTFCDGKDNIETMCRAAYEKNLYALGFSAHAPTAKQIGRESGWNLKENQVDEYIAEVLAAKKRWHEKLNVFLGYEADYIKGRRSPLDSDITSLNLDYIIGSVHDLNTGGSELFSIDGPAEQFKKGLEDYFEGDAQKLMHKYYDAIMEMILGGGFDILGHTDLIKMNCQGKYYWPQETETKRQREIAQAAAQAGLVIEVNTGGINRKKTNEVYPSLSFLNIIREFDIPLIITADAHCAKDIIGNYDIALQTLDSANFNEHVIFDGKINGKALWKKVKISKKLI